MTILCGTDFSDLSDRACRAAAALARKSGDHLILIHALTEDISSRDSDFAEVLKTAETNLQAIAETLRREGVDVSARVEPGSPDSTIAAIANEVHAGLIVVGAAGHRGSRWSLGSTADRIISAASVPVLVVREGFPIEEWLAGSRPLRIAVATDLSPISDYAVEWASGLGRYGRCEFVVTHVSWPPEAYDRLGIEGPMVLDRTHPMVEELVRRDIGDTVKRLEPIGTVEVRIESSFGRPADSLSSAASQSHADLLVVGHRASRTWRIWEGSVARQVIRSSPITVACVPDVASTGVLATPEIHCILAATDLSPHGNAAVAYALSIAPIKARVVIIHVTRSEESADERRRILEGLSTLTVGRHLIERGLDVRIELLESDKPAHAILAAAEREDADLVCIASRGRSRLPRLLLGSLSQEVLLLSRRPVLVVP